MLNVLINAYAVSPNWGSEPGMGWNWIINIAKYCNVFVITEGEWKEEIIEQISKLPQKNNIHFYFNPVSKKIRKMCWNQGDWRFYWYYKKWQQKTFKIAEEIIAKNKIDIIHQLNMIGFREPGYLWKFKDIPFVWGPVGGIANIPIAYLKDAGLTKNLFFRIKNFISDMQFRLHPRVRSAVKRSSMIAAMKEVSVATRKVYGKDIPVINETGTYCSKNKDNTTSLSNDSKFNILWVGKFDFRKQFNLALKSIAAIHDKSGILFHVVAPLNETLKNEIKKQIEALGIKDNIILYGRIPNQKVHKLMKTSDVLLFTSLSEGTPHVILEAINNHLPIICFDICGQGQVVDDNIGIKINLSNPEKSIIDFSEALNYLKRNEEVRLQMSQNCEQKQQECSWEKKALEIVSLYKKLANMN